MSILRRGSRHAHLGQTTVEYAILASMTVVLVGAMIEIFLGSDFFVTGGGSGGVIQKFYYDVVSYLSLPIP